MLVYFVSQNICYDSFFQKGNFDKKKYKEAWNNRALFDHWTMSKTFFQDASHAAAYALYRPSYSIDVADIIVSKLRARLPVEVR